MKTRALLLVGLLVAVTCVAMAYSNKTPVTTGPAIVAPALTPTPTPASGTGIVTLTGKLAQEKIHAHGDRTFDLILNMSAQEVMAPETANDRPVDMVIVLDRSGSMAGEKIRNAKKAVKGLVESLRERDRFALVTYSNGVESGHALQYLTQQKRRDIFSIVDRISANGGTNLGAGLKRGIELIASPAESNRVGKVILISDGQANQGITDPSQLAAMAGQSGDGEYSVTTVGIGQDFNEQLMATVADGGRGRYYYLKNPEEFLAVFTEEAHLTRAIAASSLIIHLPLPEGVEVVTANGYPVTVQETGSYVSPGNLLSGQTRTLYLTLRAPGDVGENINLAGINASYVCDGKTERALCPESFNLEVTQNAMAALQSIEQEAWEEKVLNSDYNALREEVAADIKAGKKEDAMDRIQQYRQSVEVSNSVVGSAKVTDNLDREVKELEETVEDTFEGDAPAVRAKQQSVSKDMQYDGYKKRRGLF